MEKKQSNQPRVISTRQCIMITWWSAGRGQRRAWLQWHKRPINILHNIELYIYIFCFSHCTTMFNPIPSPPFFNVKSYREAPSPRTHIHTHTRTYTHSIHRNKHGQHLIQDGAQASWKGKKEGTLSQYEVWWKLLMCNSMFCVQLKKPKTLLLVPIFQAITKSSRFTCRKLRRKTSWHHRKRSKTNTKHLLIWDVKRPPCSGSIPDVSTVVNSPPPPHSVNLTQETGNGSDTNLCLGEIS